MDKACVTHDSYFGNSADASGRPQTLDDAAAKRSEMFRERRYIRELIEKSDYPRSQRAVMRALIDHWFHHRAKGGVVHPGREKLAKKARCSLRTVATVLSLLREKKIIIAVSDLRGHGQKATHYRVDLGALRLSFGEKELRAALNSAQKLHTTWRAKIAHSLNGVETDEKSPSQNVKFGNVVPFIGKGC